jgi:hypothetical protein
MLTDRLQTPLFTLALGCLWKNRERRFAQDGRLCPAKWFEAIALWGLVG